VVRLLPDHFPLGVCATGGFTSLLTFLPSVFFTSGVVPGLAGDPVGDADGLGDGIVVEVGAGVETGLTGSCGLGSQAPRAATLAAKRQEIIIDLLIVFTSIVRKRGPMLSAA
jgi:hypothetical protein